MFIGWQKRRGERSNMADLQKTRQDSGGSSVLDAEGKAMLGRAGVANKTEGD